MKGIEKGRTGLAEERNCNNEVTCFALTLQALVMLSVLEATVASPSLKNV